jgi:hypothetical protein
MITNQVEIVEIDLTTLKASQLFNKESFFNELEDYDALDLIVRCSYFNQGTDELFLAFTNSKLFC